jgi:hypothetical protein
VVELDQAPDRIGPASPGEPDLEAA